MPPSIAQSYTNVKLFCVQYTSERPPSLAQENQLERMPDEAVNQVLNRNFPWVPADRRRGYASLSGGYVRFAADLCKSDEIIVSDGYLGSVVTQVERYLRRRLSDDGDLRVLEAVSLLTKVGLRDDVGHELEDLSQALGLEMGRFKEIANRLHDSPGFVGRGGRFLYVTPEIIARAAFGMAWRRWAEHDPEAFLRRMPGAILQPLLDRVARSASDEVRESVSRFLAEWAGSIQPEQLTDLSISRRLVALVDTNPAHYLPILRGLIERATHDRLVVIGGDSLGGQWGPRRHFVWLAERLAAFPEYFADAEAILLRLALAESEPRISNNATAIWQQSFRIALSGTATPFEDRLQRLTECVFSADGRVAALALGALEGILNFRAMRMSGPFVVDGRVRPPEWLPETEEQYAECLAAAVELLEKAAETGEASTCEQARVLAIRKLWQLLNKGHLDAVKRILSEAALDDSIRARLVQEVREYVRLQAEEAKGRRHLPECYLKEVESWLKAVQPSDFHGRLVSAVGTEPWHYVRGEEEKEWKHELRSLAEEFARSPSLLARELAWICSEQAKGAAFFGDEFAQVDEGGDLLNQVFDSVLLFQSALFARGYLLGCLRCRRERIPRINDWIDRIEREYPDLAYELFIVGIRDTNALDRALRLIDAGRLPVTRLEILTKPPEGIGMIGKSEAFQDRGNADGQAAGK